MTTLELTDDAPRSRRYRFRVDLEGCRYPAHGTIVLPPEDAPPERNLKARERMLRTLRGLLETVEDTPYFADPAGIHKD